MVWVQSGCAAKKGNFYSHTSINLHEVESFCSDVSGQSLKILIFLGREGRGGEGRRGEGRGGEGTW